MDPDMVTEPSDRSPSPDSPRLAFVTRGSVVVGGYSFVQIFSGHSSTTGNAMALIQLPDDDDLGADAELWASIDLAAARSRYKSVPLPLPEPSAWQQPCREQPQDLHPSKRARRPMEHLRSSSLAPQQARPAPDNCLQLAVPSTGSGHLWSGNEDRGGGEQSSSWMAAMPSVELFRYYQEAALQILVPGDYVMLQGKPFLKKSGWRKIAAFYNISFEIKSKEIKYDPSGANVLRSEFIVRASMGSGRFADGWGSCDRGEKRFSKPNHDIPSTAETRSKTRACQDLLGICDSKKDW